MKINFLVGLVMVLGSTIYFASNVDFGRIDLDPIVCLLLGLNYLCSAVGLIHSGVRYGMSFSLIYWFFSLIFYVYTPVLFYFNDRWSYGGFSWDKIEVTRIAFSLILIQHLGFFAVHLFDSNLLYSSLKKRVVVLFSRDISPRGLWLLIAASYFSTISCIFVFGGVEAVFYRGAVFETNIGGGKILPLILGVVVRPYVFYVLAAAIVIWLRDRRFSFSVAVFIALVPNVILNSPFGVARFFFFTLLVVILMLFVSRMPKWQWVCVPFLFLGILGSSLLNTLRWVRDLSDVSVPTQLSGSEYFYEGHFDAFEMICHGVEYVNDYGVVYGKQMAGALLFWVPRFLWESKPVGTGQFLGESYIGVLESTKNTNLSAPTVLEFYINFGYIGVLLGGAFLGLLVVLMDKIMGDVFLRKVRVVDWPVVLILCYSWVGLFLFLLRGDLLNAMAFVSGFTIAFIPVYFVLGVRLRRP